MAMFITVKAYICDEGGQENQVRKFVIDKDFCSSYNYLVRKLFQMMPELENHEVNITWRDEDSDMITITNDEELMVALMEGKKDHLHIYVTKRRGKPVMKGDIHYGVTCDACEGAIRGNRYKCQACPDFDLCMACEMAGKHNNHKMVRLAKPLEKTIDDELNHPSKQILKNMNEGPIYLLNVPRKKFLLNAEKELTKRRLINKQLKELPVCHMTTDINTNLIPKVVKSHRHVLKKVRPATKPLFDTRLPMEEVLKGCCNNLWDDFIVEKDLLQQKNIKEKESRSAPKTATPESNTPSGNESNKQVPAEDASKVHVVGEEQLTESLKQVLAQMFPNSEFQFVNSDIDNSAKKNVDTVEQTDKETIKVTKDESIEPEKQSVDREANHQTDEEEEDRISPVPLTTLAALAALTNPEFVSITTTAPSTQSLPSTPVSKSRNVAAEGSNMSLPDNIPMTKVADENKEESSSSKHIQTDKKSDVLSTLEAMGLSNDEGWLSKLVEAKHGDIEKVLQALTPTKSAERCH